MKNRDALDKLKEKYNKLVRSIELLDIYIEELSFKKTGDVPQNGQIPIDVILKSTKSGYKEIEKNIYEISHTVLFRLEYTKNNVKGRIFELKATYKMIYSSEVKFTDEIFKLFVKRNVPVNVIPFLRETIHNCMYRAGLPPFYLPLVKHD